MRIISLNANGIRAAARKGFFDWLPGTDADLVCIQETKAQEHQLEHSEEFYPAGYYCYYEDASSKKGYSGVAIYAREKPTKVIRGFGSDEFDPEGRYIEARIGNLSVISAYFPSGSSAEARQQAKYRFLDEILPRLKAMAKSRRNFIICGDWNIAHKEIDLKNWRANRKNSGFLPEERAWMDTVIGEVGFVDAWRTLYPEAGEEGYTWWSNRGQAWAKNVGWRIDYHMLSPRLAPKLRAASVYKEQRFSDHAPLILDLDLDY